MTTHDIREAYRSLSETLNSVGLGWVVHQVEEAIEAGRPVEKEARIFKEEQAGEPVLATGAEAETSRRPGKPTLMMTLEAWPDDLRLLFLIDGVRHAIVHATAIENEQIKVLRRFERIEVIRFEPEVRRDDQPAMMVQGLDVGLVDRLSALLAALEQEVRG